MEKTILIAVVIGAAVIFLLLNKNSCLSRHESLALIETKTVEIDGLTAWYRTAGDPAKRPIVFLHGWGARRDDVCGRGIDRVVTELSKNYHVVALELPGLIRSDPPLTAWSMDEYAGFVRLFVDRMNFREQPIMMGQSFGGGIATNYAARYPKDVPILILVDASQGDRPLNVYYQLRFYWKSLYDWMSARRFVPFVVQRALTALWLGVPRDHLTRENIASYRIMTDVETTYRVTAAYGALAMPTLLLWGKDDTRVTPLVRAQEIVREMPNAELIVLNGGHLMLYTNTAEAVRAMMTFIERPEH